MAPLIKYTYICTWGAVCVKKPTTFSVVAFKNENTIVRCPVCNVARGANESHAQELALTVDDALKLIKQCGKIVANIDYGKVGK